MENRSYENNDSELEMDVSSLASDCTSTDDFNSVTPRHLRQDSGFESILTRTLESSEAGSMKKRKNIKDEDASSFASTYRDSAIVPCDVELQEKPQEKGDESRQWNSQFDFLMSCISYAVGLGNVWRFPYKCYKDGGGAFLIPYVICWFFIGVPMFYFETSIGQYLQLSAGGVWKAVPIFKGVGLASMMIASLICIYYAVIIAWGLLFLFTSMQGSLPWRNCDHYFNTANCVNESAAVDANLTKPDGYESAVMEYWNRFVLDRSDGIQHSGVIIWYILLCLLLGWICVYFVIWKGLQAAGKLVWVCALFPYVIIFILLGKALTLPGAHEGIHFYMYPNMTMLSEPEVWVDAATQILYSYGIGIASLFALGCYNKYHHNTQRDAILVGFINAGTSIVAGFVVFASLGYMAHVKGVSIDEVAEAGPGLVFQTYPQIFLEMPVSQLWSILFFLMVLVLGIDSQFCQVEGVIAGLQDLFPTLFKKHKKKMSAAVCLFMLLLALPMVDRGGIYIFTLMDSMAASGPALLWVLFFEVVGMSWVFGVKRIYRGLDDMMGKTTWIRYTIYWWGFCWVIVIPVISVGIFVFSLVKYEPQTYDNTYLFPKWGQALGWLMSLGSMVLIPGYAIFYLIKTPGSLKDRLHKGITPTCLLRAEINDDQNAASSTTVSNYQANLDAYVNRSNSNKFIPTHLPTIQENENSNKF